MVHVSFPRAVEWARPRSGKHHPVPHSLSSSIVPCQTVIGFVD